MAPPFVIPSGAQLDITFPAAFGQLYSTNAATDVACYAYGGLTILTACWLSGPSALSIITGQDSNQEIPIQIYYFGLITYPTAGVSISSFSIGLSYIGTTLSAASTFPTITIPPINTMRKSYCN
jgi:hypothetical protein